MGSRSRRLAFTAAAFAVAALALAAAAFAGGAGTRVAPRLVKVPEGVGGENIVAYGRSRVLLLHRGLRGRGSITRLRLDGSLDRSFGDGGTVHLPAEDAAVAADGKIVVAAGGGSGGHLDDARIVRLLADGRPDRSFGRGGTAYIHLGGSYSTAKSVALAGGEVLAGIDRVDGESQYGSVEDPAVARLTADGSPDRSFGHRGAVVLPAKEELAYVDVEATPSGGAVVQSGGGATSILAELDRGGALERHFGSGGYAELNYTEHTAGTPESRLPVPGFGVLADGSLIGAVSGYLGDLPDSQAATRLRPDGHLDRSYGDRGWAYGPRDEEADPEAVALLPGGELAVATSFGSGAGEFGAVVFTPGGHLDRRFAAGCRDGGSASPRARSVAAVGGRPVVLSSAHEGASWLLECPSP